MTPVEGVVGTVDGSDSFLVRAGPALGDLAVLCFARSAGMFVDAGVTETECSEAADVLGNVIEELRFQDG